MFKQIRLFFSYLKVEYIGIRNRIRFNHYKRKADNLHKTTGKRYHVIPNGSGGLMVVDNTFIDIYNKEAKGKAQKITIDKLLKASYYSTSVEGLNRKKK